MQITLSENDLANAVKLYLAYSGVVRSVSHLDFARKIRGEDAGITVNVDMTDQDLDPQKLEAMALQRHTARELNLGMPQSASAPATQTTPAKAPATVADAAENDAGASEEPDTDVPLGSREWAEQEAAKIKSKKAKKKAAAKKKAVAKKPESTSPFDNGDEDDEDDEDEPAASADEEDVPASSPFAAADVNFDSPVNPFGESDIEDEDEDDAEADSEEDGDVDEDDEEDDEEGEAVSLFG